MLKKILVCCSLVSGMLAGQCQAGGVDQLNTDDKFIITPLPRVDMRDGVGTVSVEGGTAYWRAYVFSVTPQKNADGTVSDLLVPAKDVTVSSPIFGSPGSVRVATKSSPDGSREIFYRIVLVQQKPPEGGIKKRFSVSIPVVQAPNDPKSSYECRQGGVIHNTGNVHLKALVSTKDFIYVLPGTSKKVPASATDEKGRKLCPDQAIEGSKA